MGTWGSENFENDQALDFLNKFIENILADITDGMVNLEKRQSISYADEYKLIPLFDIYITICIKYDAIPSIDLDTLKGWQAQYLTFFDKDTTMYPETFKQERREAIVNTFERLKSYILDWI
mgnify:CR=1 FL=1